jgi:hypothetical protein
MVCNGLRGRCPIDTRSLRELIKEAVSAGTQGIVAVSRGDDLRPLLLIAAPLRPTGNLECSNQPAGGVVFISDPDQTDNPTLHSMHALRHRPVARRLEDIYVTAALRLSCRQVTPPALAAATTIRDDICRLETSRSRGAVDASETRLASMSPRSAFPWFESYQAASASL